MADITVTTNQQVIEVTTTGGVDVTNTTDTITILPSGTLIIQGPDTYSLNASTVAGGANLNLLNSNGTNDAVKFASGTGITVSRTDADTITITNNVVGDVVGPSSATDNAVARFDTTTGKLIQNSTAILTDTGDLTLAGDLTVTGSDITTGAANNPITITRNTASTNGVREALILRVDSTGTPAVGIGTSLTFQTETAVGVNTTAGGIILESTSVTPGSETFNMNFNVGIFERMVLDNAGNLQIDGDLTVSGNDIKSSSATALTLSGADVAVAGDLTVTGRNITTGVTDAVISIDRTSSSTNSGARALILKTTSTGTPAVGFGTQLEFEAQTGISTIKQAGVIEVLSTNITSSSEDFRMNLGLMRAGAPITSVLSIFGATGDVVMADGAELSIQGLTSGSTNIGAPATGSTITYVLPGAQGAASSVLTNDGAGTLSWTTNTNGDVVGPASATDNAVARFDTTTGKLIQNSLTTIDDSGNIVTAGTLDVQGGTVTDSTGALGITSASANNITISPGGTLALTMQTISGQNPNADFTGNIVKGVIRDSAAEATGDIWRTNYLSTAANQTTGLSIDNTDKVADKTGIVLRSFGGGITGGFPSSQIVFENARGTSASPLTLNSGNRVLELLGTGYSGTDWVANLASAPPAVLRVDTAEAWASNTNVGTQFSMFLQPTATTLTTGGTLVGCIVASPQSAIYRSDSFTFRQGKTGSANLLTLDVSGNAVLTGDLRINGNDIQSSTGVTAITLSGADATVAGSITSTLGNITATAGNIVATAGNISTTVGSINANGAFDNNEALSATANLLDTNTAAGSSVGITTKYWTSSAKTTLSVPQSGNKLGNFRFNSNSDSANTYVLGAQVNAEASENWTSSANGSRIIFFANRQGESWTTGHTNVISAAPESASISSNTITLESSAGTDYAVLDANTAKFNVPVTTELTTTTISEGTTYTPAATVDNNISVQINTLSGGTTVIDLINLTGNSRGASYNILVFNNTASGTPIQVKNTRINSNNLTTHTITSGDRIIVNAFVVGDYATATHLVVA